MAEDLGNEIIDSVQKRGWYVVHVLPLPDHGDDYEICSYTIGLAKTLNWPELICFGRATDEAAEMFRLTIAQCWGKQLVPHDHLMVDKVLRSFPVKLTRNDNALSKYLGLADWYAEQVNLPKPERLQLMWPDHDGRFPDDPACDPAVRDKQTPKDA